MKIGTAKWHYGSVTNAVVKPLILQRATKLATNASGDYSLLHNAIGSVLEHADGMQWFLPFIDLISWLLRPAANLAKINNSGREERDCGRV